MNFSEKYAEYLSAFERELIDRCEMLQSDPSVIADSMTYSLLAGGKRIRPVLFFAVLDALGKDYRKEADLALALECVHTYSLVHDDLPALDNDDFRRGKPSNHQIFGEANAILAGDALLSYSFDLLLGACTRSKAHIRAAQCFSHAAGMDGMLAGQFADLLWEGKGGDEQSLLFIYTQKTGRLLSAPAEMAAILAEKCEREAAEFGKNFGILFQLIDDILDEKGEIGKMGKTLGKDRAAGKLTCVRVFGMEESERLADEYAERCRAYLKQIDGDTAFLADLVDFARSRDH